MLAQGVDSVYLTDAFGDLIEVIEGWSGARYGHTPEETKALKVLADHGRAMSFLATDGIEPSNEGRGYVLRRVIRRAVQHGRRIGLEDAIVEPAARPRRRAPGRGPPRARRAARPRVGRARRRGGALLAHARDRRQAARRRPRRDIGDEIGAEDAFRLHDTYGFPIELTVEIAAEHGKTVDEAGFADAHGRAARPRPGGDRRRRVDVPRSCAVRFRRPSSWATSGSTSPRRWARCTTAATARRSSSCASRRSTPRGGGQVADRRLGRDRRGPRRRRGRRPRRRRSGRRSPGSSTASCTPASGCAPTSTPRHAGRRWPTTPPPTCCTPPCAGVLGDHVDPGRVVRRARQAALRLPPRRPAQRRGARPTSRRIVNEHVIANHPLHVFVTTQAHARELGATMLFGEKYGEHVRVVEMPGGVPRAVRRHARALDRRDRRVRDHARDQLVPGRSAGSRRSRPAPRSPTCGRGAPRPQALRRRVAELEAEVKRAVRDGAARAGQRRRGRADRAAPPRRRACGSSPPWSTDADGDALLQLSDRMRAKLSPAAVVLGGDAGGKAHLLASFDGGAQERGLSAVDVIRAVAPIVDGGGGGRPAMARAGGSNPAQLEEAVRAAAEDAIREQLPGRPDEGRWRVDYGSARTGAGRERRDGHARPAGWRRGAGKPAAGMGRDASRGSRSSTRSGSWSGCRSPCEGEHGAQAVGDARVHPRARGAMHGTGRDLRRAVHDGDGRSQPPGPAVRRRTPWPPPTFSRGICARLAG